MGNVFDWKVERKRKLLGTNYFLFGSTKLQSLQNREKTREKLLCMWKEYLVFGALLLVLPFFFSFSTPPTSFIHFGLLFIFFYFIFILVSSCFPFYASIFFSFFFTSFLFLFLFFLKNLFTRFCILFLLLSPFFFFFFF